MTDRGLAWWAVWLLAMVVFFALMHMFSWQFGWEPREAAVVMLMSLWCGNFADDVLGKK